MLDKDQLNDIVAGIAKNYSEREEIFFTDPNKHFPNKLAIVNIVKDLRRVMFPRYFGDETPTGINPEYFIGETLIRIEDSLRRELREALLFRGGLATEELDARVDQICATFFSRLPEIQRILLTDVQAAFVHACRPGAVRREAPSHHRGRRHHLQQRQRAGRRDRHRRGFDYRRQRVRHLQRARGQPRFPEEPGSERAHAQQRPRQVLGDLSGERRRRRAPGVPALACA